jgi:flagellar hook-associated protein 1 FlgK
VVGGTSTSNNERSHAQLVSTAGNKARQVQISNTKPKSDAGDPHCPAKSVSGVNQMVKKTADLLMFQQMCSSQCQGEQTASIMFDVVLASG